MIEKDMTQSPSTKDGGNGNPGRDAASSTSDRGISENVAAGAREMASDVKHMAGEVAGEAKKAAETKLGAGKDFATEHLDSVADALRKTGKELRTSESGVTEYVDMAAGSVEKVSEYLRTRTLSELVGDLEGYARREPAVFLGGAFFVGLLGGRFLKSASPSGGERRGMSTIRNEWQPPAYKVLPARSSTTTNDQYGKTQPGPAPFEKRNPAPFVPAGSFGIASSSEASRTPSPLRKSVYGDTTTPEVPRPGPAATQEKSQDPIGLANKGTGVS